MECESTNFVCLSVHVLTEKWHLSHLKKNDPESPAMKKYHVVKLIASVKNLNNLVDLEKGVSTFWQP